jgi:hypothetical protein
VDNRLTGMISIFYAIIVTTVSFNLIFMMIFDFAYSPSIMTESPSRIVRPTKKYSTESEELSCPSDKDDDDVKSDAEILK